MIYKEKFIQTIQKLQNLNLPNVKENLQKIEKSTPIIWIDGSKSAFDGWEEDEPDHTRGNEHCAIMDNEEVWDDKPCPLVFWYDLSIF